jgi:hypothetical protein
MKPVFGDTGFFLALINPRDQYHRSNLHRHSPALKICRSTYGKMPPCL